MSTIVQSRLEWVDLAKGFGIILVVIGHTTLPIEIRKWIYSFHMPLFFYLSGYFFKSGKYSFLDFFIKRCRTLLIPFMSFVFFNWIGFDLLHLWWGESTYDIINVLKNGPKDPIWFLTTLFVVEICHHAIDHIVKIINNLKTQGAIWFILCVILVVINYLIIHVANIKLPYEMIYVPHYLMFYIVGRNHWINIVDKIAYFQIIILLVIDLLLEYNLPYGIGLNPKILLYVLSYLVALLGVFWLINFSFVLSLSNNSLLRKCKSLISFWGANSIVILGLHTVFVRGIKYVFHSLGFSSAWSFPFRQLLLWIILSIAILFINKYTPWLVGKKYERNTK